jgi:mannose-6-phosphate isomerase-like protein (cupin superfamily)
MTANPSLAAIVFIPWPQSLFRGKIRRFAGFAAGDDVEMRAPMMNRRMYNIRMKHFSTSRNRSFFKPLYATADCQAAMMTLQPGQSTTGQPENEHPRSEQWLFVISGSGRAIVRKKRVSLKEGSLLLVEKNEPHQITNTGRSPMRTINFYAPPAYTSSGNVRPSVKVAGMLTRVVDALT